MIGRGNFLSYYRKLLKKSAIDVAAEARMSLRFYRAIERGEMIPGAQYVGLLEKALRTPFKLLFPQFFSDGFLNPKESLAASEKKQVTMVK